MTDIKLPSHLLENPISSTLALIERMAINPAVDADKMAKLLDMQLKVMDRQAEIAFTEAMTRLMPRLPVIDKKGTISFKDKNGVERKTPFARYEDIDEAIRPLLIEEGFSLSFDTEATAGAPLIKGTLSHKSGHYRTVSMPLPLDTSGSKNNLQAMGSTISYGKRYLVGMLLNIITRNEDDDGGYLDSLPIDTEKAANINTRVMKFGDAYHAKFLAYMKVNDVREIMQKDFKKAITALEAKERAA